MITENILAVIIITFKYFSNTFGYYWIMSTYTKMSRGVLSKGGGGDFVLHSRINKTY